MWWKRLAEQFANDSANFGPIPLPCWRWLVLLLTPLSLIGCTPYHQTLKVVGYSPSMIVNGQPRSFGHSEQRLGQGWYRVRVGGHANAPQVWLRRIAEARAAELTLKEKQTYFLVESVDTQIHCSFQVTKHKRDDKKKREPRHHNGHEVHTSTAERVVYVTFRMAGHSPKSGLLHAQQTFGQELKVIAGPQPHKAEKQVAYDAAMQPCRAIASDHEDTLNNRPAKMDQGTWTERVTVRP